MTEMREGIDDDEQCPSMTCCESHTLHDMCRAGALRLQHQGMDITGVLCKEGLDFCWWTLVARCMVHGAEPRETYISLLLLALHWRVHG